MPKAIGDYSKIRSISASDSLKLVERYGDKFCGKFIGDIQIKSGLWKEMKNNVVVSQGYYFPFAMCNEIIDTVLIDDAGDTTHVVIDYELVFIKDSVWNYYDENGQLIKMERYDLGKLIEEEKFR